MKTLSAIAASLMIMGFASASAQTPVPAAPGLFPDTNPGIAVAGSYNVTELPQAATDFITKHFKDTRIVKCEQYYAKQKIEVELSDGVDIDFTLQGKVMEVDAPDGAVLPVSVVKDLLHRDAYARLVKHGVETRVESIEFNKKGRAEVEVVQPGPDTFVFDINGTFLFLED